VTVSDLTEAELIARIQARLPPAPEWVVVGIGDDAAVVEPERNRLQVLTTDSVVEGVHFDRRFTPPDAIGHRALAVNLSDLAAMGASPRLALLSLVLPPALPCSDFDGLVGGLAALAERHRLPVVGGNLSRSPGPVVVDVTLVGSVKPRQALTRSGARPGDALYVTGTIGGAAAGLQMLQAAPTPGQSDARPAGGDGPGAAPPTSPSGDEGVRRCVLRYLYATPRVKAGLLIARNRAATACVDLSDGLADGVRQLARAGGVGFRVDLDLVPVDPDALQWFEARGPDASIQALSGGDDYELLFTSRPKLAGRLLPAARHAGVPLTRIGVCTAEPELLLRRDGGSESYLPMPAGFGHFG
jgi:thiamine-monophosphate kinase